MLGSIARKLRIFGFDTIYIFAHADDEILKIGIEQDRVILTADKECSSDSQGWRAMCW